jgi:hypothetical protein
LTPTIPNAGLAGNEPLHCGYEMSYPVLELAAAPLTSAASEAATSNETTHNADNALPRRTATF